MQINLIDLNPLVVGGLKVAFSAFPEVSVAQGDILAVAENAIVSPANSYGFMDGGIDAAYLDFFGMAIQSRVQETIARRPEGHLPVGASAVVRTGNTRIPYLILAPTMMTPEPVAAENAYRAMRAVLRIAATDPNISRRIFCPGLATHVGRVAPEEAAREMAEAYRDWTKAS